MPIRQPFGFSTSPTICCQSVTSSQYRVPSLNAVFVFPRSILLPMSYLPLINLVLEFSSRLPSLERNYLSRSRAGLITHLTPSRFVLIRLFQRFHSYKTALASH